MSMKAIAAIVIAGSLIGFAATSQASDDRNEYNNDRNYSENRGDNYSQGHEYNERKKRASDDYSESDSDNNSDVGRDTDDRGGKYREDSREQDEKITRL